MQTINPARTASRDWWLAAARVSMALLFVVSGLEKALDYRGFVQFAASHGVPFASPLGWLVIVFELAGAACIIAGWRTREVSILFVLYILVLGPWFHPFWRFDRHANPVLAQMMLDDFFHHFTMAGGFVVLAVFGPGRIRIGGQPGAA